MRQYAAPYQATADHGGCGPCRRRIPQLPGAWLTIVAAVLGCVLGGRLWSADNYWVGGTGSWNQTARWALTSGGAAGAAVPAADSLVFFNANSGGGTATVDTAYTFAALDCTGYTGTLVDGGQLLTVNGNCTFASGMGLTATGTLTIGASATLTSGGKSLRNLTANTGTLTLNGAAIVTGVATIGAAVANGGNLLTVNSSGSSTIAGVVSGTGGLSKSGSGSLTLSNVNTYTGNTAVSGGSLWVNGSLASGTTVAVTGGATVGGSGTINGSLTTANATTIAPGASAGSIGTLTLTKVSPWAPTAFSNLNLDINGASADQLNCTAGSGSLNLSNVWLNLSATAPTAASYTLVSYPSGSLVTPFAYVGGIPTGYAVVYSPTSVSLVSNRRYWVAGSGLWNDPAHWSYVSGGASGAPVPNSASFVYFDGNSGVGTATMDAHYSVVTMNCSGYAGTLADGGYTLSLEGDCTLASGMTLNLSGELNFAADGMLYCSGRTLNNLSASGTATLVIANTTRVAGSLNTAAGTSMNMVGQTLHVGSGNLDSVLAGAITATGNINKLGTGSFTLTGANTTTATATVQAGSMWVNSSFAGNVNVNNGAIFGGAGTASGGLTTAAGATVAPGASNGAIGTVTLSKNSPWTVSGATVLAMDISGASADRVTCSGASGSLALGNLTLALTCTAPTAVSYTLVTYPSGTITGSFAAITGVPAGFAVVYNSTSIVLTAVDRYWVGGTGSWGDTARWAAYSGGPGGLPAPTAGDRVRFDANSGGGTATVGADFQAALLDCTGFTGTIDFGTSQVTVGGNVTLASGGAFAGTTGGLRMGASGTLTPPGSGTIPNLTISAGTTVLATNDLSLSGSLSILSGATLASGGRAIALAGDWSNSGIFTAGTGMVMFTGAGGSTQTISGSTTFNHFTATCATARTLRFAAGTTQMVGGALTLTGASGQPLALRSAVDGSVWNLNYTGSRSIAYVAVQDGTNLGAGPLNPAGSTDLGNSIHWFAPLQVVLSTPVDCPPGGDIATYGRTLNPRPALIWFVPAYRDGAKLHFAVSIDGSTVADSSASQVGFDYFDGSSWTMTPGFPVAGVDQGSGPQLVRWRPAADLGPGAHTWAVQAKDAAAAYSSPVGTARRFLIASPGWMAGLAAGMPIRVGHLNELRQEVDYARNFRGLADMTLTDAILTPRQTLIRKLHLDELRVGLSAVSAISGSNVTIGAESITARQTPIKADHLAELRSALEGP